MAWNSLLDHSDPYSIFLSHEWFTAWFEAYGEGRTPYVLLVEEGHELLGALPLHRGPSRRLPLGGIDLQMMANGHSPYADMVARPENARAVRDSLLTHLRTHALTWERTTLPELSGATHLARLTRFLPDSSCGIQQQRNAPYIALQGSWEEYRNRLSKRFVKVLRNNRNRVTRDAETRIECLRDRDAITAALEDVYRIGEKSWQGQSGTAVGSTPANRRFYAELVRLFAPQGRMRLWFLVRDGERVAFEYHLLNGGVEFGLKTGFDRRFEKIGIGTFLDQSILEQLFADSTLREYDLLGDFDFYKQRWTTTARAYYRVTLYGGGWTARARALWNLRLLPMLRQQEWLRQLRELAASRSTARQET
jgi:CelD/BcsL family acetyltransferase involved in cellulose biosynthesis